MSRGWNAISDAYCFKRKESFVISFPRNNKQKKVWKRLGFSRRLQGRNFRNVREKFGYKYIRSGVKPFLVPVFNVDTGGSAVSQQCSDRIVDSDSRNGAAIAACYHHRLWTESCPHRRQVFGVVFQDKYQLISKWHLFRHLTHR
jgi:hypothetical protein